MSFAYDAARDDARAILADFGQRVTLIRPVLTGGDPADPEAGQLSGMSAEGLAVVLPVSPGRVGMGVGDTVIGQDDVTIYAAADLSFAPEPNDQIVTALGTFRVLGVTAIAPAGITVVHEIMARA